MSRLGKFAKRFEQLQRGLLDQAELQFHEAVRVREIVEEDLQSLMSRRETLRQGLKDCASGQAWQETWNQLQVLETIAERTKQHWFHADVEVNRCSMEVTRIHQEAERWEDVAAKEFDREHELRLHRESVAADERAMQAFGRMSP